MTDGTLRVATWNIHMAIGRDGRRDLGRTADVIRGMAPHVIGLQEVDNRVASGRSDLDTLMQLTGLHYVSGPTMQRARGDYGNALLTSLPILDIERHDISFPGREPRGLLIAHLGDAATEIHVAVTHLGLRSRERRFQVDKLITCLKKVERTPLVLMGDFNEWLPWSRPLRRLRGHFDLKFTPATFPASRPLLCLDRILCDQTERIKSLKTFATPIAQAASDHLPLVATLDAGCGPIGVYGTDLHDV